MLPAERSKYVQFPQFGLNGKVALVTGATKGIGYGLALALAQGGARMIVVSRNQIDCDRVATEISSMGFESLALAADVTKIAQVNSLVEVAATRWGHIDILVNNAGTAITKKAEDLSEEDYDRVVNLNQKAVFFMAQAVGRKMIQQNHGSIINIASIFGLVGDRQILPYAVAKGGVLQMSRSLALEWAKYGVRVNAVCPGYVVTPMNQQDLEDERIRNHILKSIPLRRIGRVEDMTGAVVFLASEASAYMTGQFIVVDGGWTAQ